MPGKFDELLCIVKSFENPLHLIILTETWLKSDDEAKRFRISGYTHYYNNRTNARGGGISIFVNNNLKHNLVEGECLNDNHFLWIYLRNFSLNVGAIYRKPDTNIKAFLDKYSHQLDKFKRGIVFGDFNINLLASEQSTSMYRDVLEESGYRIINKIDKAHCTRETSTSKTLIDHVSCNLQENNYHLAIIESSMSDHKQLYFELKRYEPKTPEKVPYVAIDYEFLYKTMADSADKNENNLFNILEERLFANVTKSKILKYKILNSPRQDWINKLIINEINCRNVLWKEHKHNPEDKTKHAEFITKRNEVAKMIQQAKSSYYLKSFAACNKKPAKMWSLINSLSSNKIKEFGGPAKRLLKFYILNKN
ncbi:unnamed protein product [Euphydryas editha]|uniref:Tick transposon n=1 Tax=Euphydryas editha TaxID=104508 RepID=A0AAU9V9N6_EUPED|nr:unnamed protein product [Euphydryas editha]